MVFNKTYIFNMNIKLQTYIWSFWKFRKCGKIVIIFSKKIQSIFFLLSKDWNILSKVCFSQNVRWVLFKVRRFQVDISNRLVMAQENLNGGFTSPRPPDMGLRCLSMQALNGAHNLQLRSFLWSIKHGSTKANQASERRKPKVP